MLCFCSGVNDNSGSVSYEGAVRAAAGVGMYAAFGFRRRAHRPAFSAPSATFLAGNS